MVWILWREAFEIGVRESLAAFSGTLRPGYSLVKLGKTPAKSHKLPCAPLPPLVLPYVPLCSLIVFGGFSRFLPTLPDHVRREVGVEDAYLPWGWPASLNLPAPDAPVDSLGVLAEDLCRFWYRVPPLVEFRFYTLAAGQAGVGFVPGCLYSGHLVINTHRV